MQAPPGRRAAPECPVADDLLTAVGRTRDRAAFAALYRHFAPRLKTYLMRLGCGAAEAEELMQEAMIMVWRRADSFDPARAGAAAWIFAVARHKRIDAARRRRGEPPSPEDLAAVPAADAADTPEASAARRRDAERVRRALDALPPDQAALVRMSYFDDKAHSAIATEVALPLGTVKSRLRLALGRLRRALAEEQDRP